MSRLAHFVLLSSLLASAALAASPDSRNPSLLDKPLNKLNNDELKNLIRRQDTANATATASPSSDSPLESASEILFPGQPSSSTERSETPSSTDDQSSSPAATSSDQPTSDQPTSDQPTSDQPTSPSSSAAAAAPSSSTTETSSAAPTSTPASSTEATSSTVASSSDATSTAASSTTSSTSTSSSAASSSSSASSPSSTSASSTTSSSSSSTTENSTPFTSTFPSTTTMANGERKTVTAVTVVHPAATADSATPGLQTDSAGTTANLQREFLAMMGGAAVVAMAL